MFNFKKGEKRFRKKNKVGLCLSGGGTKGFAYLGVFKAFEEAGISFDMVAGTSVGSLFGAMYSFGFSYKQMEDVALNLKTKDFKRTHLTFLPSKLTGLQNIIKKVVPFEDLEETKLPFFAVAVDLRTGKAVDFSSGPIATILSASCAVPWVFVPVKYKDMLLVDGMVLNNIPADVLVKKGCDYVVSIDCNATRAKGTKSNNLFTQALASMGLMMTNSSYKGRKYSDILIELDTQNFSALNIANVEEMIKVGYEATMARMNEIKELFCGKYTKMLKKNKKVRYRD